MGANQKSTDLANALEAEQSLKQKGFTATCGPTGGVVVDRWNHVRGVWHFYEGSYFWTPAGYSEPTIRVATHEQAVAYAVSVISKT